MKKFIFVNGWASDSRVWAKIVELLNNNSLCQDFIIEYYDFGYTGQKNINVDFTDSIIISHSLGVIHCYNHINSTGQNPQCLINISGFTKFAQSDNFKGINKRILQRMHKKLRQDMNSCLFDFHINAGSNEIFTNINWNSEKILQGMDYLISADVREIRNTLKIPEYNLWGSDDKIVSQQMTQNSFDTYDIIEDGVHFLPIQMPEKCCEFILKNAQ